MATVKQACVVGLAEPGCSVSLPPEAPGLFLMNVFKISIDSAEQKGYLCVERVQ